jgi:hypothetical protein
MVEEYSTRRLNIRSSKLTGIIFAVVGLVFLGVGILVLNSENAAKERLTGEAIGVLEDAGRYIDDDGDKMYSPSYAFEVSGQKIICDTNVSSSTVPQDETAIYYNPSNFKDCQTEYSRSGSKLLYYIFIGMGGLFTFIGVVLVIAKSKK